MRIGVVAGPGEIGGALADWWTQAGHEVVAHLGDGGPASVREAAGFGDAVLFAPDWAHAHELVDLAGGALAGKPVLDATSPPPAQHGLELLTHWSPRAHWVKAFNTLPVEVLDARRGHDPLLTEFLCTDWPDARQTAAKLVKDLGLAPMYAGGADRAWLTETGPLHLREVDIQDATALLAAALDGTA
ncbi:NADPH-dependent F420 reductase [Actinoplanes sp. N902-109]|uniref:NADPH-dependent F420 reductase n=1 Tax=Actinoplanes sp. (strain N902-109) TaxID=649831 RepID=UPI0003294891|nr:NADPH-dependent F420 reductase [Actinoplanes sp. N902-109]AGL17754.1 NADPH-dependent F420 reductase [Actinoplanes sp. N902-109]